MKLLALIILGLSWGMHVVRGQEVVDVLVVYSQQLENNYNGRSGVGAHLNACFFSANEAFENSQADVRIRLVGFEKVDYDESISSMEGNLDHLADRDGRMDSVFDLRDEYGADLVYFFRSDPNGVIIGVTWLLEKVEGEPDMGFGVVAAPYALSDLVLQHEVGHNLGGAHDRENSSRPGLYPDSYGNRFEADYYGSPTNHRTVMAYWPGIEINYFSNPDTLYKGVPTGVASGSKAANNVRAFNDSAQSVAGYRTLKPKPPVVDAGADRWVELDEGSEMATVTLDGSRTWVVPDVHQWHWSWPGGSADGKVVDVQLPVGDYSFTLEVVDEFGLSGSDTVNIKVVERSPIVKLSNFGQGMFVVRENGVAYATGNNSVGELGIGREGDAYALEPVLLGDIAKVSSDGDRSLFLTKTGALYGSGRVQFNYQDHKDNKRISTPELLVDSGIVDIALGYELGMYLNDKGELWGWGRNRDYVFGPGETNEWNAPKLIAQVGVGKLYLGNRCVLVHRPDGSLAARKNLVYYDSLNDYFFGEESDLRGEFVELFSSGVEKLAVGDSHAVVLKSDGSVWAWGKNEDTWVLGRTQPEEPKVPVQIVAEGAVNVWAGRNSTVVQLEDGSVWGVGKTLFTRDGFLEGGSRDLVRLFGSRVEDLNLAFGTWLIHRNDGSIWAVGQNYGHNLGLGPDEGYLDQAVPLPWATAPSDRGNKAPVATVEGDLVVYDVKGDGFGTVRLDAGASVDDWSVASIRWSWNGLQWSGSSFEERFPRGTTPLVLEVEDDDGAVTQLDLQVLVKAPPRFVDVEVGRHNIYLLDAEGGLWGLGPNDVGQLGELDAGRPTDEWKRLIDSGVVAFAAGDDHVIALKSDGSLWASGRDDWGQLGDGARENRFGFAKVVDGGVTSVKCRGDYSLFLKDDGSLWGMGTNYYGELGGGDDWVVKTPIQLINKDVEEIFAESGGTSFKKLDGSFWMSSGWSSDVREFHLLSEGEVEKAVWGEGTLFYSDEFGALRRDRIAGTSWNATSLEENILVHPLASGRIEQLETAGRAVFVRMENGSVLGLGTQSMRGEAYRVHSEEVDVVFGSGVSDFAVSREMGAFLLEDGSLWVSGMTSDVYAEWRETLLTGRTQGLPLEFIAPVESRDNQAPVANAGGDRFVYAIAGGDERTVVLSSGASHDDRFIVDWEWTWNGNMRKGRTLNAAFPVGVTDVSLSVSDAEGMVSTDTVQVEVSDQFEVVNIAAGPFCSIAILDDGSAYVSNWNGQNRTMEDSEFEQHGVALPIDDVLDASVSNENAAFLRKDGSVWFWGYNGSGQAGLGFTFTFPEWHQVVSSGAKAVSVGPNSTLVLMDDGSLWGAGQNYRGQLGLGEEEVIPTLSRIVETGVVSASIGGSIAAYVKEDGSLWQMGIDLFSDEWDSTTYHRVPYQVLSEGAVSVAAGDKGLFVTMQDGSLYATRAASEDLMLPGEGLERWRKQFDGGVVQVVAQAGEALVRLANGSLWRVANAESYYDPGLMFKAPERLLNSGVKDAGFAGLLALRSDGLLFGKGNVGSFHFGKPAGEYYEWNVLAGRSTGTEGGRPVAEMDAESNYLYFEQGLPIRIGVSKSQDDWTTETWEWKVDDVVVSNEASVSLDLQPGFYRIELSVWDDWDGFSRVVRPLSIVDRSEFESWLGANFTEDAIANLSDPLNADPDSDGFSNVQEMKFGTDPNRFGERPKYQFDQEQNAIVFRIVGVKPDAPLDHSISFDLLNWSPQPNSARSDQEGVGIVYEAGLLVDPIFFRLE